VVPGKIPIARSSSCLLWGRRLTSRCSEPPNHKVLGRGRPSSLARGLRRGARVLTSQLAVAELGR
jgi:hypothetical protein